MNRLIVRWTGRLPARIMGLAAGLLLTAGCDMQPRLPVSGVVQFDGQPVEVGQIALYPMSGTAATEAASDIHNGRFELSGPDAVRSGKYRVHITAMRRRQRSSHELSFAGPSLDLPEQYIPEKYNERTILEVEVQPDGDNHFEFDLEPG